jgi:hypothetical protein
MFELIALLGGFWFIVFIGLIVVTGIVASEIDNFALGTATFVIALIGAQVLFDIPVWAAIASNPLSLVLFITLFTLIGAAYTAIWRWPEFLRDNASTIKSAYNQYKNKHKGNFDEFLQSDSYEFTAAKHKDRLATWIITWPFSLVWELSRKPIKYVYKIIYEALGGAFERIGISVARRIHEKNK